MNNDPKNNMSHDQQQATYSNSVSWSFAEKLLTIIIDFIVSIVLARMLLPKDYGTVAALQIFIVISQVFVNFGLGSALIQRKKLDELDYSTALIANVAMGMSLYALLFCASPLVAKFYGIDELDGILKIMALQLPLASVYNILLSRIQKQMQFKKLFFSSLFGTLASGVVGIVLAYRGMGAWALVAATLTDQVADLLILFVSAKWLPKPKFSLERFKTLNSFAWKVIAAELVSRTYNQISNLIIGRVYTSSDLAYSNKGQKIPLQVAEALNTTVIRVLFPAFSSYQDDTKELVVIARRSVRFTSFCLCPIMVGVAVTAYQFIPLMLTEAWNPCIPYLQMYCFVYLFQPVQSLNIKIIQAVGRSDITLKSEFIKKGSGLLVIIAALLLFDTPFAVAGSFAVVALISLFVNGIPCQKLVGYGFWQELKDIAPFLLMSGAMGAVVISLTLLNLSYFPTLILQIIVGVAVYMGIAKLTRCKELDFAWAFVKNKLPKKKR